MAQSEWVKGSRSTGMAACVEMRREGEEIALRNSRVPNVVSPLHSDRV